MAGPNRAAVLGALSRVQDPELGQDVVSLNRVRDITIGPGGRVHAKVVVTSADEAVQHAVGQAAEAALQALEGVGKVTVEISVSLPRPKPGGREVKVGGAPAGGTPPSKAPRPGGPAQPSGPAKAAADKKAARLPNVRTIIGVGAGKGGVGKSTVAVNLAAALAMEGHAVGLLDADVYGPSVPIMMGLSGSRPAVNDARQIIPLEAHGVRFMSMGLLVKAEDAVVWRGPMIGRAVTQFVDDVAWGELDVLVVDLPPGTGDIVLSLAQTIPMTGAIVVATPQDVAFADVKRAVRMFEMLDIRTIGLVENMAFFHCPDNGKDYEIFGPSRTEAHCAEHGLTHLARLPIDMGVSPNADAGRPIVVAEPNGTQAEIYRRLAQDLIGRLDTLGGAHKQAEAARAGFFSNVPDAARG